MFLNYLLLVLSTCAASGKAIFCKLVGVSNKDKSFFLSNFKSFAVAFVLSLVFFANKLSGLFSISTFSILLSILFGLFVFFTQFMQILAMKTGSATLTTLIYSCGFLIPVFYSAIVFKEVISVFQIIGIAILLVAIFLIVYEKNQGKTSIKWFVLAMLAMLGSGTIAIIQKTHQLSDFSSELPIFLVYAFLFCALFSLLGHLISCKFLKEKIQKTESIESEISQEKAVGFKAWLKANYSALILGAIVAGLNFLNLLLSGKIPSVILFPVNNVGNLILTSVLSILIFKEKIKTRQTIGCIIGVCAILIVGLF